MPPYSIITITRSKSMRCLQCNVLLTNQEACHKDEFGNYLDTCFGCLYTDFAGEDDSLYDDLPEGFQIDPFEN